MVKSADAAEAIVYGMHTAETLEAGFRDVSENVVVEDWTKAVLVTSKQELLDKIIRPADLAFLDGSFEIRQLFSDPNRGMVLVDAVYHANFVEAYKGIEAHGQRVSWRTRDMFRVQEGMITHMWYGGDTLEMLQSLGAVDFEFP